MNTAGWFEGRVDHGALALGQTPRLRVAGKVEESVVDGPGLRFVLFVQGCPHACCGCHNPQTHDPAGGVLVDVAEVERAVRRNPLIEGVTLSGGEPFAQAGTLTTLASRLATQGYHLMAYTGFVFEELVQRPLCRALLGHLDLLVDGPYVEHKRSPELRFRGSANQRVLDVPLSLRLGRAVLSDVH